MTELRTTDGLYLCNEQPNNARVAGKSSGLIAYARVIYNPNMSKYRDTTHIRFVMVHELGHVLGLGHPNTTYDIDCSIKSVMLQYVSPNYYTPQQHDINDLNIKY